VIFGGHPIRHFRTERRTPGVAGFAPAAAVSVRSRLHVGPMMRLSCLGGRPMRGQGSGSI